MAVGLYMDVHVPWPITDQLRRRGIDVLTAAEDGANLLPDDILLRHTTELNRLLFTQDIGFKTLAEDWQRRGQDFFGLLFGHQLRGSIGQYVKDLELIARASEVDEWKNTIAYLPF